MKSGILSFNKGLFMQHMRSILWISIFFLLSQIVLMPLGLMTALRDELKLEYLLQTDYRNFLFSFTYELQYLSYLVFPVIAGIVLTSYMTKKGSSDFMHSLPFKRGTQLFHVYAAGFALLALPILINAVILLMMRPFVKPITYSVGNLLEWLGVSLFITLFMFIVTVMIGLFIGPALLQGIMVYGILVLPAGLIVMTLANARYFVNGLAVDSYTLKVMTDGIFLVRAGAFAERPFSGMEWVIYLVLAAVIVAVSFYVYKVRPAEAVDEAIVFPFFRWAFIFVLTYVAMLIGGLYFSQFLGGSLAWTIAGYVIGAFAGYTLLQMIVQKSLRLVWPWKGFAFYVLAILIILIPGTFAGKSYEKAVPEADEVEKVYIGDSIEPFEHNFYTEEIDLKKADAGFMKGADSIEEVQNVHAQLIDLGIGVSDYEGSPVSITYGLKDGSRVQRQYMVSFEEMDHITDDLRKNAEFIKASNPLFAIAAPEKITYLSGYDNTTGVQLANVAGKEDIEAIRAALEKDALSGEADQFNMNFNSSAGSIELWVGKESQTQISVNVDLDDEHTIQAIRKHFPGGESFASAANVEKAFIVTADTEEQKKELSDFIWSDNEEEPEWSNLPLPYEQVKDTAVIKQLIDPGGLTEDSSRLLVLKWKGNGSIGYTVSVVGLKE
jgi:ABC-2 type transport system permease protein